MIIFLKKYLPYLILITFLALYVGHVYMHAGFPYTHDGENHLARFANYAIAVRELQLPPRFAPNLMNHYGYPVFDFNYPLANILSLSFSALKVNYELAFKVISLLAVAFGCVGSLLWLQVLGLKKVTQVLGALVFCVNPYLVSTIAFRGNIGEILAICFLPWVFYLIEKIAERKWSVLTLVSSSILFAGFFLSHNIAAVFSIPIFLSYALLRFQWRNFQAWRKFGLVLAAAVALTLWFWLPALLEKSVTVVDAAGINTSFFDHFPSLTQLLFSPQRFGFSYAGLVDTLSFGLGVLQVVSLVFASIELLFLLGLRGKELLHSPQTRVYIWATILLIVLAVFQLQVTQPIWHLLFPIAKYLQFPWRLSLFWGVIAIPVFAFTWEACGKYGRFLLAIIFIWQVLAFSRTTAVDYFHRQVEDYNFFAQSTSTLNENRTRSFTFTNIGIWQPAPQVLSGSAQFAVASWRGSRREYDLTVEKEAVIIEPTMNFLGWQTRANGNLLSYIDSPEIGGRIAYNLPAGQYHVKTEFTQWTWPRVVGNSTSIFAAVLLGSWLLIAHYQKKHATP